MNENTLVTVHGYSGDSKQISNAMQFYLHHSCPVLILSPTDAPIAGINKAAQSKLMFRSGGKRAYIGQLSLERQRIHLQMMLEQPFDFFLANDSDSVCIEPVIPRYLYDEPEVLWSNIVSDMCHDRSDDPGYKFPRLAFQPPYFMHRKTVEKLIAASYNVPVNPRTPFIDWCMMSWCVEAGVPYKTFRDGVTCPTANYRPGQKGMEDAVANRGAIMLHSIKTPDVLFQMAGHRVSWKRKNKIK